MSKPTTAEIIALVKAQANWWRADDRLSELFTKAHETIKRQQDEMEALEKVNAILANRSHAQNCADQLEAALPKWTKMTDDPETWPESNSIFVFNPDNLPVAKYTYKTDDYSDKRFFGTHWRPLCSIDTPPDEVMK